MMNVGRFRVKSLVTVKTKPLQMSCVYGEKKMKNILSYITPITGQDILDWLDYQATHETSHKKEFIFLKRFSNVRPNRKYRIDFRYPKSNKYFSKKRTVPFILRVKT